MHEQTKRRTVHRRPELGRIMEVTADFVAKPITVSEQEFLNLVIIHFNTGRTFSRSSDSPGRMLARGVNNRYGAPHTLKEASP
jgi:hypothetical protein